MAPTILMNLSQELSEHGRGLVVQFHRDGDPLAASVKLLNLALGFFCRHIISIVTHGETGFLCSAGDGEDFADKMGALWDAPLIADDMGVAGRAWVESDFAPDAHLKRILEVYASVGATNSAT